MRVAYTQRAKRDLQHIYDRGLKWGERVARQAEKRIVLECRRLGRTLGLGVPTEIVDVRRLPIRRYPFTIFFYRIIEDGGPDVGPNAQNETDEVNRTTEGLQCQPVQGTRPASEPRALMI